MNTKLAREVRLLKGYAVIATLGCATLFTLVFVNQRKSEVFEEIDVERVNIVEENGQLRMVISNQARQHPGIVNGKMIERKAPRPPGLRIAPRGDYQGSS